MGEDTEVVDVATAENVGTEIEQQEDAAVSVARMMQSAIEQGASVESIERLVGLYERMEDRRAEKQFNAAMARFQENCPPISKTAEADTGKYKYRYAPLDSIIAQVGGLIHAEGLSWRFKTEDSGNQIAVRCIVSHTGGHTDEGSVVRVPIDNAGGKNAVQGVGSSHTYAKRYAFEDAFGLTATEMDDDGHGGPEDAPSHDPTDNAPEPPPKAADSSLTAFANVGEMVYGEDWPGKREDLLQFSNVDTPEKLTEPQIKRLIKGMRAKAQNRGEPAVSDDEIPM